MYKNQTGRGMEMKPITMQSRAIDSESVIAGWLSPHSSLHPSTFPLNPKQKGAEISIIKNLLESAGYYYSFPYNHYTYYFFPSSKKRLHYKLEHYLTYCTSLSSLLSIRLIVHDAFMRKIIELYGKSKANGWETSNVERKYFERSDMP